MVANERNLDAQNDDSCVSFIISFGYGVSLAVVLFRINYTHRMQVECFNCCSVSRVLFAVCFITVFLSTNQLAAEQRENNGWLSVHIP